MPFAPGRLSTMTCCPQDSVSFWPTVRASRSDGPPGAKGTITRMGRVGYVCAPAVAQDSAKTSPAVNRPAKAEGERYGDEPISPDQVISSGPPSTPGQSAVVLPVAA